MLFRSTAVRESRDRVTTALQNSQLEWPRGRTTINLAPADIRKEGPSFDLPIAVGILAASRQVAPVDLAAFAMVGELALTGAVRPVKGALGLALRARGEGLRGILLPAENAREAAVVEGLDVIPIRSLHEAARFLAGEAPIRPLTVDTAALFAATGDEAADMDEVRGQESVKRALEITAAGSHNILLLFFFTHFLYSTKFPVKTSVSKVFSSVKSFLFYFYPQPMGWESVTEFPSVTPRFRNVPVVKIF